MAVGDVSVHFIQQFESEVYEAFQNKGGIFQPRVRVKQIMAEKTNFPKIGISPEAQPKSRKGKVPLMDILRDRQECSVSDWYSADMIDQLDELKTNVNEKEAMKAQIVHSMRRKWDSIAQVALQSTTNANNNTATDDSWSSDDIPRLVMEQFGNAEAMADGENYALISWKAWADALELNSFINSQYGGDTRLTSDGMLPKMWFGFHYAPYSRLTRDAATNTKPFNIWWHKNVVGVAENKAVTVTSEYLPEYDATFIMAKMSLGSVLLDITGAIKRRYAG
jgi:hypothetical protein